MSKKHEESFSWEDFQSLGNPDNAPDLILDSSDEEVINKSASIRIYLDRKNRRGKSVTLIKGLEDYDDGLLMSLSKELKSLCGVGGSLKYGEIMLQGDHRDRVIKYLITEGYTNVKKSGG